MQRGAKLSLALNEPNQVALHSNSNTTSKVHHSGKKILILQNEWKIIRDELPVESAIELKDNSIIQKCH